MLVDHFMSMGTPGKCICLRNCAERTAAEKGHVWAGFYCGQFGWPAMFNYRLKLKLRELEDLRLEDMHVHCSTSLGVAEKWEGRISMLFCKTRRVKPASN